MHAAGSATAARSFRVGDLVVDVGLQHVLGPAGDIALPKLSFDLLLALIATGAALVYNDELAAVVWAGVVVSPETVTKRVNLLRDALGDHAAQPRYIVGLRSRGYRIVAPVTAVREDLEASAIAEPVDEPDRTPVAASAIAQPAIRSWLMAAIVAGLAVVIALGLVERPRTHMPRASLATIVGGGDPDASVAVLPFENLSPSTADAYLAVGVPEMVLDRLATIPRLTVIVSGSAFRIDDLSVGAQAIGRRLGARYLVLGSTQRAGDQLRVTARLVDTVTLGADLVESPGSQRRGHPFDPGHHRNRGRRKSCARASRASSSRRSNARHEPPVEAQLAYLQARALLARYTVSGSEEAAAKFDRPIAPIRNSQQPSRDSIDARMLAAERRHNDLAAERKRQLPLHRGRARDRSGLWPAHVARAQSGATGTRPTAKRISAVVSSSTRAMGEVSSHSPSSSTSRAATTKGPAYWIERCWWIPLSPRLHFRLVMRDFDRQGIRFRESGLKHVLEIDPDYQPALQRYAKRNGGCTGRLTEAAQLLEHAIEVGPRTIPGRDIRQRQCTSTSGTSRSARGCRGNARAAVNRSRLLLALYRGDWRTAGEVACSPAGTGVQPRRELGRGRSRARPCAPDGRLPAGHRFLRGTLRAPMALTLRSTSPIFGPRRISPSCCRRPAIDARARGCSTGSPRKSTHRFRASARSSRSGPRQRCSSVRRSTAALRTLADSFAANDLLQWWYTLDHDPLWQPLARRPVFKALAARCAAHVAAEQAALHGTPSHRTHRRRGSSRTPAESHETRPERLSARSSPWPVSRSLVLRRTGSGHTPRGSRRNRTQGGRALLDRAIDDRRSRSRQADHGLRCRSCGTCPHGARALFRVAVGRNGLGARASRPVAAERGRRQCGCLRGRRLPGRANGHRRRTTRRRAHRGRARAAEHAVRSFHVHGAIHYVPRAATREFTSGIELGAGSDDYWAASGFLSGPLPGAALLGRVAAGSRNASGTWTNSADGNSLGDYSRNALAASVVTASPGPWKGELAGRWSRTESAHPAQTSIDGTGFNCGAIEQVSNYWSYFCGSLPVSSSVDLSPGLPDSTNEVTQVSLSIAWSAEAMTFESDTSYYRGTSDIYRDFDSTSTGETFGVCTVSVTAPRHSVRLCPWPVSCRRIPFRGRHLKPRSGARSFGCTARRATSSTGWSASRAS